MQQRRHAVQYEYIQFSLQLEEENATQDKVLTFSHTEQISAHSQQQPDNEGAHSHMMNSSIYCQLSFFLYRMGEKNKPNFIELSRDNVCD